MLSNRNEQQELSQVSEKADMIPCLPLKILIPEDNPNREKNTRPLQTKVLSLVSPSWDCSCLFNLFSVIIHSNVYEMWLNNHAACAAAE